MLKINSKFIKKFHIRWKKIFISILINFERSDPLAASTELRSLWRFIAPILHDSVEKISIILSVEQSGLHWLWAGCGAGAQ